MTGFLRAFVADSATHAYRKTQFDKRLRLRKTACKSVHYPGCRQFCLTQQRRQNARGVQVAPVDDIGIGVLRPVDAAVRDGRIKPGDLCLLEAMGGGFTWGAVLIRA